MFVCIAIFVGMNMIVYMLTLTLTQCLFKQRISR